MALQISKSGLEKIKAAATRAKEKYAGAIKKGEQVLEQVVHTAEVGVGAFTFGVIQGRYGGIEVVGVPASLLTGGLLHTAGFFLGGKAAPHLHGFGDGALASFAHTMGHGTGKAWRQGAKVEAVPGDEYTVKGEDDDRQIPEGERPRRSVSAGNGADAYPGVRDRDLAEMARAK